MSEEPSNNTTENDVPSIQWDSSNMKSTYANVCNVTSTREEFSLLFGTNQTWNRAAQQVTVELTDRIILNPYAAKRLTLLLNNIINEYENRFGEIQVGAGQQVPENTSH